MTEEKEKGKRGVRLNKLHQQSVKDKIQGAYLINRLMKHVDGDLELTSTQVDGIKFLLNKLISNAPVEQIIDAQHEHGGEIVIKWQS
jgi:hypothetical protein